MLLISAASKINAADQVEVLSGVEVASNGYLARTAFAATEFTHIYASSSVVQKGQDIVEVFGLHHAVGDLEISPKYWKDIKPRISPSISIEEEEESDVDMC